VESEWLVGDNGRDTEENTDGSPKASAPRDSGDCATEWNSAQGAPCEDWSHDGSKHPTDRARSGGDCRGGKSLHDEKDCRFNREHAAHSAGESTREDEA
jgi:hypothetical protein